MYTNIIIFSLFFLNANLNSDDIECDMNGFPDINYELWDNDSLGCNGYRGKVRFKFKEEDLIGVSKGCIINVLGEPNMKDRFGLYYSISKGPFCYYYKEELNGRKLTLDIPPAKSIIFRFKDQKVIQIDYAIH